MVHPCPKSVIDALNMFFVLLFVGENVNILANEHKTKNTCRGEKTHCRYSSATERNNI
jgi:hypothetical protein